MHQITLDGHTYGVMAHNHYIQLMYDQGVIGLLLFGALVVACLVRCRKKRVCVAVALIGMLALGMSLSFNSSAKTFWNLVAYAAFVFAVDRNTVLIEIRIRGILPEPILACKLQRHGTHIDGILATPV